MATFLPSLAQKFMVAQRGVGYTMRTKDVNLIHHFVLDLSLDVTDGANSYVECMSTFSILYPVIGTTAASHSLNLVNPSTYALTYFNTPTQNDGSIGWNGTTQYALTGFNSAGLPQNNRHMAYYSTLNTAGIATRGEAGTSTNTVTSFDYMAIRNSSNSYVAAMSDAGGSNISSTSSLGFFHIMRKSSTQILMTINGTISTVAKASTTPVANNIAIGKTVVQTGTTLFSDRPCGVFSMGTSQSTAGAGSTTLQLRSYYNAVVWLMANK